jgi:glycosyltransferase involved in cell wall biosynthesis
MDIVFVHGNYPGQFLHLVPMFSRIKGNRVVFLTANENPQDWNLPNVEIRHFKPHRSAGKAVHPYLRSSEAAVLQGQAVLRELEALGRQGLRPRLIFSHAGNGLGLFVKDLFPTAVHISYHEWYFQAEISRHLFANFSLDQQLRLRIRNMVILQELVDCDLAVTPTAWQRSQFPAELQNRIQVVFDGVDPALFHPVQDTLPISLQGSEQQAPLQIRPDQRVLSYATRGMEPLRGFAEFMRMLPPLLRQFDDLIVVIAGTDRVAYSYSAPSHGGSWKQHLLAELGDFPGRERVHFTGGLPYGDYARLLQRSDLHVYFSRPYVTSWGLFQAAACGARLMLNRGPATEGIVPEGEALLVNLDDQAELVDAASGWLQDAWQRRRNPRSSLLDPSLQLRPCLRQWQQLIRTALA